MLALASWLIFQGGGALFLLLLLLISPLTAVSDRLVRLLSCRLRSCRVARVRSCRVSTVVVVDGLVDVVGLGDRLLVVLLVMLLVLRVVVTYVKIKSLGGVNNTK